MPPPSAQRAGNAAYHDPSSVYVRPHELSFYYAVTNRERHTLPIPMRGGGWR